MSKEIKIRHLVERLTVATNEERFKKLIKNEDIVISLYDNSITVKGLIHGIVEVESQAFGDSEDKILAGITTKSEQEEKNIIDFRCPVYNIDSIYAGYSDTADCEFVSILSMAGSNVVIMCPDSEVRENLMSVLEDWLLIYGDHIKGAYEEDITDEDYDKLIEEKDLLFWVDEDEDTSA